jgi:hypothetical protein
MSNRVAARVALAAALILASAPASALADECAPEPTSQPFTHLGDYNSYFLAEGGDFEGTMRWTTSGPAGVQASINPVDANGALAAKLSSDGSVSSPPICVDALRPHLRFGALARSGTGVLRVDAVHENGTKTPLGRVSADAFRDWATTPMIPLGDALAIPAGDSRKIRLRISAIAGGDWLIDAVYIDPYLRG